MGPANDSPQLRAGAQRARQRAERARDWAQRAAGRAAKLSVDQAPSCVADPRHGERFLVQRRQLAVQLIVCAVHSRVAAARRCAAAARLSAEACDQVARAHERLAKAQSGDVREHWRQVADYQDAASFLREAVDWYRDVRYRLGEV